MLGMGNGKFNKLPPFTFWTWMVDKAVGGHQASSCSNPTTSSRLLPQAPPRCKSSPLQIAAGVIAPNRMGRCTGWTLLDQNIVLALQFTTKISVLSEHGVDLKIQAHVMILSRKWQVSYIGAPAGLEHFLNSDTNTIQQKINFCQRSCLDEASSSSYSRPQ